ncbi:MAG: hypothetical protein WCX73_03430 [Candidatus Pacearchaeota archaeon]|jgi:hypothetical protein
MVDWSKLADIATFLGIVITISSILILYFGKIIRGSMGDKKSNLLTEGLGGFLFLIIYLIIPSLIIYLGINLKEYASQFIGNLIGLVLIIIQAIIFFIYETRKSKKNKYKTNWRYCILGIIASLISLGITFYFIYQKDLFFSVVSILFSFMILTFIAIKRVKYEGKNKK